MKRKGLRILGILLGVLVLLVVLAWPAAPLLVRLGVKPVCFTGDLPHLKMVDCPQDSIPAQAVTPIPLPTQEAAVPIPLVFDDDGSADGILALLFFLRNPLYKVEAVAISSGEAHPGVFSEHMVRMLSMLGRSDIPVGAGRETPLEGSNAFPDPWRRACDAFWDIPLPEAPSAPRPRPAAELIVETINNSPQPVAVFVSGTHTNLAEALRLDPGIRERIRAVYIMGGSVYIPGNIESAWPEIHNQVAEWNIWVDPLAAKEVFNSGIPLVVMPLDGTNQVTWTEADMQAWDSSGTPEGRLAAEILRWILRSWNAKTTYIWDLTTAAAATDPSLCPQVALALDVITAPGPEQGRTVVVEGSPNAQVCLEPDARQVRARVEAFLAK